jgi:hypothetical protein
LEVSFDAIPFNIQGMKGARPGIKSSPLGIKNMHTSADSSKFQPSET